MASGNQAQSRTNTEPHEAQSHANTEPYEAQTRTNTGLYKAQSRTNTGPYNAQSHANTGPYKAQSRTSSSVPLMPCRRGRRVSSAESPSDAKRRAVVSWCRHAWPAS